MSFKPNEEIFTIPPNIIPKKPTLMHFEKVIEVLDIPKLYFNTFITASVTVATTIFLSTLAGYAFAKFRFFAKDKILLVVILKLMLPEAVLIVPWFYIMGTLGLIDTLAAVILPSLIGCWTIFFMRQYIYSIPDSLIDSARIDGTSEIGVFTKIVVPLIKPGIGASVIVNFMFAWDWFLWPLVILNSSDKFTMNLGLHFIRWMESAGAENPTPYGPLMAACSMTRVWHPRWAGPER